MKSFVHNNYANAFFSSTHIYFSERSKTYIKLQLSKLFKAAAHNTANTEIFRKSPPTKFNFTGGKFPLKKIVTKHNIKKYLASVVNYLTTIIIYSFEQKFM